MAKGKDKNVKTVKFSINGMTCHSCEKLVSKQAMAAKGVTGAHADYVKGEATVTYDANATSPSEIAAAISKGQYSCCEKSDAAVKKNPLITILLSVLVLAAGAYILFGGLNIELPAVEKDASFALVFIVGLLTGFHCIAMCGGFVVSYTTRNSDKGGLNLRQHAYYGIGKTLSYALIGGMLGLAGSFITFTPFMRGIAAVLAGLFLIIFGLNMLGFLGFFRRFRLKTPAFAERLAERGRNSSPLVIGLLNGLMIACGPLQAMYVFAAASGSPVDGALYLGVFGLGTLPVLLGFGVFTSFASSNLAGRIVKYSGVAVILLGLLMLNRGASLAGFQTGLTGITASASDTGAQSPAVSKDGFQEIRMNVTAAGWKPDTFVLIKGVPVKWVIDGQQITTCNREIQVPKYGLRFAIKSGLQTIEFTPTESGIVPWSCWMGMIPGKFIVKEPGDSGGTKATVAQTTKPTTIPTTTLAAKDSGTYQEIHMNVTASGWSPNKFLLKKGVPVKWVINGIEITGCNRAIKVPKLGLSFDIKPGLQTIEFTPNEAGTIDWSCWMGMIKGVFEVKDDVRLDDPSAFASQLASVQAPSKGSGGGCGCGMM
ncbi:MAG: sulfite exporter TauE/SafE family protein [Candidatus Altiarchaeota archaeon]|nr:sulfite exporter TauE/SafE family protein [Candidatus Altiarchaeota archaeon]